MACRVASESSVHSPPCLALSDLGAQSLACLCKEWGGWRPGLSPYRASLFHGQHPNSGFCLPWGAQTLSVIVPTGARWDTQTGVIAEARLKDLTPVMPVIFIKAIPVLRRSS